ncbi:Putative aldehyde dehydrogenase SA1924 [Serratia fonticola]|uniref:Aldehyde dehydrogenase SA1924 n=1 Tax=Serratia fonticola TaxID=47917 RepID=A0A4U9TXU6_SERFO|nr:Putative aldehyde dehydrogenase SA1924 [Serratia fonticola]
MDPNTQVGALISPQHWEKVSGYIRLGIEEGATLLAGGPDKPAGLTHGNFLRPTVLADVNNNMRVAQEEIFGPVACLLPFKSGRRTACAWPTMWSTAWRRTSGRRMSAKYCVWPAILKRGMVFVNTQNVRRSAPAVWRGEILWHRP